MIKYLDGNLFDFIDDHNPVVIAHICNDQGAWGAGFVLPLAAKYPAAKFEYRYWFECDIKNTRNKHYSSKAFYETQFELGGVQLVAVDEHIYVANMVAQTLGGVRPLYYNHLSTCMDRVARQILSPHKMFPSHIICPQFGSGLAGGDWNVIEQLIIDCWIRAGINVTVVRYKK